MSETAQATVNNESTNTTINVTPTVAPLANDKPTTTMVGLPAKDQNDLVSKLIAHPNYGVTFTNRRKIVFHTIYLCALILVGITGTICYAVIFENHYNASLNNIIILIFSSTILLLAAIIGSYVFGATFEYTKFNSSVGNIISSITNIVGKDHDDHEHEGR